MNTYRISCWVAVAICATCLLLTGCTAVSEFLGSDDTQAVAGGALDAATAVAQSTGSPVLLGIVGILNGLFALWAGKRAAKKLDQQDWSGEDVTSLVAALQARGYKVER